MFRHSFVFYVIGKVYFLLHKKMINEKPLICWADVGFYMSAKNHSFISGLCHLCNWGRCVSLETRTFSSMT